MEAPVNDGLVDDLVADLIGNAGEHVKVAQKHIEKLMQDQRLIDRYGDMNLGVSFGSITLRSDVHKALKAKGLSVRQIAATTGTARETVRRDVADPSGSPVERETDPDGSPVEVEAVSHETFIDVDPEAEDDFSDLKPAPYTGRSVATPQPMPDPRPEVVACIKSIKSTGSITLTERRLLQDAINKAA